MTDFELQVMTELAEIKSTVTAAAAAAVAASKAAENVSTSLDTRLFDPVTGWITFIKSDNEHCATQRAALETRMHTMEEKHKHDDIKDYIHYGSAPFVVAIHALLRHLGINI